MGNWHKRIELFSNVGIIVVAILLGVVLLNRYILPTSPKPGVDEAALIKPGTKVDVPGVDWSKSDRTLLMMLSTNCRYCTESAPFYQRLAQEKAKRGHGSMVAVLPQGADDATKYLHDHGVVVDEIKQATPSTVGARATPTLILVDRTGSVIQSWVGKLPVSGEVEVLNGFLGDHAEN